jgi:hypothetical protein
MKSLIGYLTAVIFSVMAATEPLYAQNRSQAEASARIIVLDPAGASVPGAAIKVVDQPRTAVADARGEALIAKIPPRKVRFQVEAPGFATIRTKEYSLKPGENRIEIRLEIASVADEITVGRDKREASTDPRGDAFTSILTAEQLAQLPDDPEEFEQAIRNMAGPGASLRVNGFRGGKLPPKNQIREIRFRTNAYAAENHESSFINIDIYTKPGIENWHGSMNIGFRDESLNARNAFAGFRAPEQNRRFGFDFGGPLWKNHTSLFLSADGVNSFEAKTIVAALPDEPFRDQIRQPWRSLNLNARLEHLLTPTHTAQIEYQRNATRRDNNGVGNFDFAERGYTTDTAEHILRFADSGAIGKKLLNEIRFQTRWEGADIDSLSQAPTVQVLNAFTSGGAQITSSRRLREFELADNLDWTLKKHTIRVGALLEAATYNSLDLRNQSGTFVFSSLDAYRRARPTTFTQRSGQGEVEFNQVQLGWYAQEDWRVQKSLTLSYGLRHEWQTNPNAGSNFMPRFGFAWSPFRKGNTTIRGGAGVFYDWFGSETYEQALRVDGRRQSDLVIRDPGYPDPATGGQAITLPSSVIRIDPSLRAARIARASLGVEQNLPSGVRLMAQYAYTRGSRLLRGRNLNAPLDGVRPDPALGNITQIESSASSFTHTFMVNVNWFKMGKFALGANYMWSKATNEADSALSLPANNFNLRAERGPASQDIRHRMFALSSYTLPKGFRLSGIFQANTALPYTITTGFDDNGDTTINDRPASLSRNSARGAGRWEVATRLAWGFSFGKIPESTGAGGPRVKILRGDSDSGGMLGSIGSMGGPQDKRFRTEFFLQATNLFNHTNPIAYSGVQTSLFFSQPTAATPARRIETGMRFSF